MTSIKKFISKNNGRGYDTREDFLKDLSKVVEKDIKLEDTKLNDQDYQRHLFSEILDIPALILSSGGLKQINPLDTLRVRKSFIKEIHNQDDDNWTLINKSIEEDKYYPFDYDINFDIRANFLLQLGKDDNYEKLMNELEAHIEKVMDKDDWLIVKNAIVNATPRIEQEKLLFLQPFEKTNSPRVKITKEISESLGITDDSNYEFEIRNDTHDLVALKELVEIVKGKEVHPLSIGFGFFLKYMPEITQTITHNDFTKEWFNNPEACVNEIFLDEKRQHKERIINPNKINDPRICKGFSDEDFKKIIPDSIIFKVNNKTRKLERIELGQVPVYRRFISTGAMIATTSLHFKQTVPELRRLYGVKNVNLHSDEVINIEDIPENERTDFIIQQIEYHKKQPVKLALIECFNIDSNTLTNEQVVNTNYLNDYSYYVCVPSQVAGPKVEDMGLAYNKISHNSEVIRAGECYLFEKPVNEIIATRLYFVPYRPSEIHPILQYGSVVFGHNDMSYHPCHRPNEFTNQLGGVCEITRNNLIDDWETQTIQSNSLYKEPIFVMSLMIDYYKKKGLLPNNISDLLKDENREILLKILEGRYAYSQFLLVSPELGSLFLNMSQRTPFYLAFQGIYPLFMKKLLTNLYPFNERFSHSLYVKDFKGIDLKIKPTQFKQIADDFNASKNLGLLKTLDSIGKKK